MQFKAPIIMVCVGMSLLAAYSLAAAESPTSEGAALCIHPCTETIFFDRDAYKAREAELPRLLRLAHCLKDHPQQKFVLIGHTDEQGSAAYNLGLGQRRAEEIKFFLATEGIDVDRLTTLSSGEGDPLDTDHGESAWTRNRRVEIMVPANQ